MFASLKQRHGSYYLRVPFLTDIFRVSANLKPVSRLGVDSIVVEERTIEWKSHATRRIDTSVMEKVSFHFIENTRKLTLACETLSSRVNGSVSTTT